MKGAFTQEALEEIFDNMQSREFECKMNVNERQYGRINEMLFSIIMDDIDSSFKKSSSI